MNLPELLKCKFPTANFLKDIKLRDIGKGPEIYEWNLRDPKPTQKDLDQWAKDYDLQYRQQKALERRVYPSINEQLDMIYNDSINKTTAWIDSITKIKDANPKPME